MCKTEYLIALSENSIFLQKACERANCEKIRDFLFLQHVFHVQMFSEFDFTETSSLGKKIKGHISLSFFD